MKQRLGAHDQLAPKTFQQWSEEFSTLILGSRLGEALKSVIAAQCDAQKIRQPGLYQLA